VQGHPTPPCSSSLPLRPAAGQRTLKNKNRYCCWKKTTNAARPAAKPKAIAIQQGPPLALTLPLPLFVPPSSPPCGTLGKNKTSGKIDQCDEAAPRQGHPLPLALPASLSSGQAQGVETEAEKQGRTCPLCSSRPESSGQKKTQPRRTCPAAPEARPSSPCSSRLPPSPAPSSAAGKIDQCGEASRPADQGTAFPLLAAAGPSWWLLRSWWCVGEKQATTLLSAKKGAPNTVKNYFPSFLV
jgi:hypothetical protein